jgi:hypothetical protein
VISKADLRLAAILCGLVGLYDVVYLATTITRTATLGYSVDVMFPDFMVFHAAARAAIEGKLALVYDNAALTHLQNTLYKAYLPYDLGFRPFLYPPLWLLDVLLFGFLSLHVALAIFLALTIAAACVGMRAAGLPTPAILLVVASPAAIWVLLAGQNTFLSVALFYGGFALLERKPIWAGVLLGLLAYKPQVWVLVPLALLCAREWRALAATAATVIVLSLVTLVLFGSSTWLAFLDAARTASSGAAAAEMYERVHAHMTTLLAAGKMLGLSTNTAMVLQVAGFAGGVAAVVWAFWRHGPSPERTAVLVTATFLVSPYTLNYDLLLLMPAAALLFLWPPHLPGERIIHLAVWLIPHLGLQLNAAGMPLIPVVVLLFGAVAVLRLAKVELPRPSAAR